MKTVACKLQTMGTLETLGASQSSIMVDGVDLSDRQFYIALVINILYNVTKKYLFIVCMYGILVAVRKKGFNHTNLLLLLFVCVCVAKLSTFFGVCWSNFL